MPRMQFDPFRCLLLFLGVDDSCSWLAVCCKLLYELRTAVKEDNDESIHKIPIVTHLVHTANDDSVGFYRQVRKREVS